MFSRFLTRREQGVLIFVAVAIVVGSLTVYSMRETPPPEVSTIEDETLREEAVAAHVETAEIDEVPPRVRAEELPPVAAPLEVVVSVQGAIRRAGVYTLGTGARVSDLIEEAGGLTDLAQSSDINMAARLMRGFSDSSL